MTRFSTIALTTLLLAIDLLPLRAVRAQSAVPLPIGCASNPYCIGTVVVGGILYYVVQQNGQTQRFPVEGEYLEDPEGDSEDWSDYVEAGSPEAAQAVCQGYAQRAYAVLVRVRRIRSNRYECFFRTYKT